MNRPLWITWAVVAAVGLQSGCQSSSCGGGLFSGLTCRRGTVVYDGPVLATPMSSGPFGCCDGGPMLGQPPVVHPGMPNGVPMVPAPATLPSPTPVPGTAPPPLAPVPGTTPPLATPVPAQPSGRYR